MGSAAHAAQLMHYAASPAVLRDAHHLAGSDNARVFAAQAHCSAACLLDEGDKALIHTATQHHLHHVHCGSCR